MYMCVLVCLFSNKSNACFSWFLVFICDYGLHFLNIRVVCRESFLSRNPTNTTMSIALMFHIEIHAMAVAFVLQI